jgi:hypothetical protein
MRPPLKEASIFRRSRLGNSKEIWLHFVISGVFLVFVSTPTTLWDYPKNFANFF